MHFKLASTTSATVMLSSTSSANDTDDLPLTDSGRRAAVVYVSSDGPAMLRFGAAGVDATASSSLGSFYFDGGAQYFDVTGHTDVAMHGTTASATLMYVTAVEV